MSTGDGRARNQGARIDQRWCRLWKNSLQGLQTSTGVRLAGVLLSPFPGVCNSPEGPPVSYLLCTGRWGDVGAMLPVLFHEHFFRF